MSRTAITDTPTAGQPAKAATVLALVGNDSDHETRLVSTGTTATNAANAAASAQGTANSAASTATGAQSAATAAQGTANTGVSNAATAQAAAATAQAAAAAAAAGLTRTGVKTAAYTAAAGDLVPVDTTAAPVPVTLPTSPAVGTRIGVKLIAMAGTNWATVVCGGTDVLNAAGGDTTLKLRMRWQGVILLYGPTGIWTVTEDSLTLSGLDGRYTGLSAFRRRDLPGWNAVPKQPAVPLAYALGPSSGTTTLAGSILVLPWEPGAFTYSGTVPNFASNVANNYNAYCSNGPYSIFPNGNSHPWAAEFDLDTTIGAFEVKMYGQGLGATVRVVVNDAYVVAPITTTLSAAVALGAAAITTAVSIPFGSKINMDVGSLCETLFTGTPSGTGPFTIPLMNPAGSGAGATASAHAAGVQVSAGGPTFAPSATGSTFFGLVNLPGPGQYKVRLEMENGTSFLGVQVGPLDNVVARPARTTRLFAVGDSFTEPTVLDHKPSIAWDGWYHKLAQALGMDPWGCSSGGTGYLAVAGGHVAARNRIQNLTNNMRDGDVVLWCMGINDYAIATPAAIGAEALYLYQLIQSLNANVIQVVMAPFWPRGYQTFDSQTLLAARDAIKASATACGLAFLDNMSLPMPPTGARGYPTHPGPGALTSAAAVGATTVFLSVAYPTGTYLRIQNGAANPSEVRKLSSGAGTGPPYSVSFTTALQNAYPIGATVTECGPNMWTGSGSIAAPVGDGNADRFRGFDGTHPTLLGHEAIARTVLRMFAALLPD